MIVIKLAGPCRLSVPQARLSFLYCVYQRLLTGCVLLDQPQCILGNFTWKELRNVIDEQIDRLTSDLRKARDKVSDAAVARPVATRSIASENSLRHENGFPRRSGVSKPFHQSAVCRLRSADQSSVVLLGLPSIIIIKVFPARLVLQKKVVYDEGFINAGFVFVKLFLSPEKRLKNL